jgi:YggT family protein
MSSTLAAYAELIVVVRYVVFAIAAVTAVIALIDWAVRTRRLNPFGVVARFFRRAVDPLMVPIETRIVSAGGQPSSAPWWSLVFVVVGGLILIAALRFIGGLIVELSYATTSGTGLARLLVSWTFGILELALFVRVLSSWVRVSPWSRWVRWSFVLTEWMLAPLRRVIPTIGPLDITPIVAYFALQLLQGLVRF